MLAFSDFDSAKSNLVEFIAESWGEKFKRNFVLGQTRMRNGVFRLLLHIKEKFRNPLSHGGFDRDAATLHFHVPGLGAVPMSLSRLAASIQYGFNPIEAISFKEVCEALDNAEKFFVTGSRRLEMHCVRSGMGIALDERSLRRHKKAIESQSSAAPSLMVASLRWMLRLISRRQHLRTRLLCT